MLISVHIRYPIHGIRALRGATPRSSADTRETRDRGRRRLEDELCYVARCSSAASAAAIRNRQRGDRYVRRARSAVANSARKTGDVTLRQPHWMSRSAVRNADGRTSIDEEDLRLQTATTTYPRNQLGVSRIRVRVRRARPRWTAPPKPFPDHADGG